MFLNCTSLTPESVDLIIDMLPTYTDSTHTITISTATPEQISFANDKGWTVKTN